MRRTRRKIIACRTVIEEMKHLLPSDVEPLTLESGLHSSPDKMRKALQDLLDEITPHTETIILAYGLCSMGVIGLSAARSTLVIPRRDDCIAIFLGSREIYKGELDREPGTYFLSKGWIDAGITLLDDLQKMEERYGGERAEMIMKRMLQHYTRVAYIDLGRGNQEEHRRFARKTAERFNLAYQEIKGTTELLEKICHGPWDREFVVVPPGQRVRFEDFKLKDRD